MKNFIIKTSLLGGIILSVLLFVNFFGDSAKLFDNDYEKKIANILLMGNNVTNVANYDERLLQIELINRYTKSPDVIVLGSSKSKLLNNSYFPDKKFANNSVSGASIEDLIAIYQIYKSKNLRPEKVLIEVSPWTFNEKNGQVRWMSLSDYYNAFFNKKGDNEIELIKYSQLVSPSYFQSSLKPAIKFILNGKSNPVKSDTIYNVSNTILPDGSLTYSKSYREASETLIQLKIKKYISGKLYSLTNYDTLSARTLSDFNALVDDMIQNKIEVVFYLSPYHPKVYEVVKKHYPMVIKSEEYVKKLAKEKNIKIIGSFNPNEIGLNESCFYDGMHNNEKGIDIIMKLQKSDTLKEVYKKREK